MIWVVVHHVANQDCWYIKEAWDTGKADGTVCYKSKEKAVEMAHRKYPYVSVSIGD
ncbi:MAG TPA: hypothetical protein VF799_12355 [Geobacteraceae bacterium]